MTAGMGMMVPTELRELQGRREHREPLERKGPKDRRDYRVSRDFRGHPDLER
jgi:hypothetical protein